MNLYELSRDVFTLSTDKARLDVPLIHAYLSQRSYWAQGRPLETVRRSIDHSLCFGVYRAEEQLSFARVVTDYATFGWLCDVFTLESERGQGLGQWLVESIVAHPQLHGLRRLILATQDAHELYRNHRAFETLRAPATWMERFSG